jgi:hypothetical protein
MKTTNYILTVYWLTGARAYLTTNLEEALELASSLKKVFPTLRITLKRERREFEFWLNLILESAQQGTCAYPYHTNYRQKLGG